VPLRRAPNICVTARALRDDALERCSRHRAAAGISPAAKKQRQHQRYRTSAAAAKNQRRKAQIMASKAKRRKYGSWRLWHGMAKIAAGDDKGGVNGVGISENQHRAASCISGGISAKISAADGGIWRHRRHENESKAAAAAA
jgi:hypothetical protein